ncbi:S1 RNA-binding domain-containing protein [Actinokineospora globicatena]|uniref:S1 motif domain-containing protein n=1 Tax=Actinokineospora globicatena TaxID=103729 RepID=A0A9W6QS99_9PSEU|nr:S1 RNA-binding domain-containing protein [Actinokineospora globicatena]MCP2305118.1 S1 RNA binding domain-containing protein [Actinokineospora globicatena]GLW80585.1 hypothetical protein Aglo01_50660 [Actinokineospora globicatena]GLW87413.1 hypothetical protein Aglo02_50520 [Actinokineospora globicatena]GLW93865.1 hypothetical protein Aglo03_46810 [Actinokineospora globicatena]
MSWTEFENTHTVGDIIEGVVAGTVPFGSWVEYLGVTGLVYQRQLPVGTTVSVRITNIDQDRQRFSLQEL